jgi:hypothetical protein
VADPDPGYFEFDWLSARHPDLYDQFALSTVGLVTELGRLVDLRDATVVEVGAGTGRASETLSITSWHGVTVSDGVCLHDFTYETDYGNIDEAAAILGRMYGPTASQYVRDREQATLNWRLRIAFARCA